MRELDVELARLSAQMESGLANIYRRFDAISADQAEIKADFRRMDARMTKLETGEAIREASLNPGRALLTPETVRWYAAIGIAAIGGTLAFLEFMGRLR